MGGDKGGKVSKGGWAGLRGHVEDFVLKTARTVKRILIPCGGDQADKWGCLKCSVLHFQTPSLADVWDVLEGGGWGADLRNLSSKFWASRGRWWWPALR